MESDWSWEEGQSLFQSQEQPNIEQSFKPTTPLWMPKEGERESYLPIETPEGGWTDSQMEQILSKRQAPPQPSMTEEQQAQPPSLIEEQQQQLSLWSPSSSSMQVEERGQISKPPALVSEESSGTTLKKRKYVPIQEKRMKEQQAASQQYLQEMYQALLIIYDTYVGLIMAERSKGISESWLQKTWELLKETSNPTGMIQTEDVEKEEIVSWWFQTLNTSSGFDLTSGSELHSINDLLLLIKKTLDRNPRLSQLLQKVKTLAAPSSAVSRGTIKRRTTRGAIQIEKEQQPQALVIAPVEQQQQQELGSVVATGKEVDIFRPVSALPKTVQRKTTSEKPRQLEKGSATMKTIPEKSNVVFEKSKVPSSSLMIEEILRRRNNLNKWLADFIPYNVAEFEAFEKEYGTLTGTPLMTELVIYFSGLSTSIQQSQREQLSAVIETARKYPSFNVSPKIRSIFSKE